MKQEPEWRKSFVLRAYVHNSKLKCRDKDGFPILGHIYLPLFTRVYLLLLQFNRAYLPLFTHVYHCLLVFPYVQHCLLVLVHLC